MSRQFENYLMAFLWMYIAVVCSINPWVEVMCLFFVFSFTASGIVVESRKEKASDFDTCD